jgi:aspartyl-tRNA(Asn)/glutamyl-tRNA(Gln) amidotransferase subunit A
MPVRPDGFNPMGVEAAPRLTGSNPAMALWLPVDSPRVEPLADLSALALRAAYAAHEVSPVEAIEAAAARIAEHEGVTNAFITLTLDTARVEAKAAEREYARGAARPLAGIPLAVKDLFDTAGVRTTYGSAIFAGHVPERDAAAVRRAREAGAIMVGKTLTHEFAWGVTSNNPHFGPCRNPWDPERVPGGSSGGSAAALAVGACALALGTDTGGSIRIPAAFCGVSGLKPTYGRISAEGVFPLARSLDHIGPMARTPADVRLFYTALADVAPEPAVDVAGLRIALCPDLHVYEPEPAIAAALAAAAAALAGAGAEIVEVRFPDAERVFDVFRALQGAEAAFAHRRAGLFPAHRDEYGADVRAHLELAQKVTLDDYLEAVEAREAIRATFAAIFATSADLVLTPVSATTPALIDDQPADFRPRVLTNTVPQDVAGVPACAVRAGFDPLGLPIGVQLTGPRWGEHRVLAAAEALQAALAA